MRTFRVPDMTCGRCAAAISRAIAGLDKAALIEVRIAEKLVSISSGVPDAELQAAIAAAGYSAQPVDAVPAPRPAGQAGCCCSSRRAATGGTPEPGRHRSACCS